MLELISETNYRETMENTVEPKLASIREELSLPLEDGGTLHAELYEQPTATRAVVVLHGYTESGEKFREMTWYFLQSGFNVYAIAATAGVRARWMKRGSRTSIIFRIMCAIWKRLWIASFCRAPKICRSASTPIRWAARSAA